MVGAEQSPHPGLCKGVLAALFFFPMQRQSVMVFCQVTMCCGTGLCFFCKQTLVWPTQQVTTQQGADLVASRVTCLYFGVGKPQ